VHPSQCPAAVWTIGHSSRAIEDFVELLESAQVQVVADVRRHAGSRAHPHFNPTALADALAARAIDYAAMPELGGRRNPRPDSTNGVWRNRSFRGYADYMDTGSYQDAIERLLELAADRRTALMCAEALWWQCHRALIADDLKSRGIDALHIMGIGKVTEHPYTSAARLAGGRLVYGPAGPGTGDLFAEGKNDE
jgi:uncharacterized protein (DUF488 family)